MVEKMFGGSGGGLKDKIKLITGDNGDLDAGIKLEAWIDRATTQILAATASTQPENQRYKGQFSTFEDFENSALYTSTILTDYVFIQDENDLYRLSSIASGGVKNWTSLKQDLKTRLDTLEDAVDDVYIKSSIDDFLALKADKSTTYTKTQVDNSLSTKADLIGGKIPSSQLPAYVDDVLEFTNLAAFPATGESGKIYIALDTNLEYRWSGSQYINIAKGDVQSVNAKTGVVVLNKADVGLPDVDNTPDTNKPISTAAQTALNLKQNVIQKVASDAAMLALSDLVVGDVVIRSDKASLYRVKLLPSNQLQNWEVVVSTGGSVSIPSSIVEKIVSGGARPTTDGLYAFTGAPTGGMPAGVVGDILSLSSTVWAVDQTFADADPSIYSKFDGKTYNKKINSSGVQTWAVAIEPSYYEVKATGDNTKQGGFTTLTNAVNSFIASNSSIGTCKIFDSSLNETATIDAVNLHIEGDGTPTRSQTQISRIILGANSHRVTLKNLLLSVSNGDIPLVIQPTGTITESGTPNVGKGKHIISGVSISTTGTIGVDVVSSGNFLTFENCDFGGKIVRLTDRGLVTPILVSFENCKNGVVVVGSGYVINKFNSPTLSFGNFSTSSYLLDLDITRPTAYSLIRLSSALGNTIPVALGQLIINDDAGGKLEVLKCKTAYSVAASLGSGTALDLTKYDSSISLQGIINYQIVADQAARLALDVSGAGYVDNKTLIYQGDNSTGYLRFLLTNKVNSTPSNRYTALTYPTSAVLTVANKPTGGAIGFNTATVDKYSIIKINQTTANQSIILPTPTASSAVAKWLILSGSVSFLLNDYVVPANSSIELTWNGSSYVIEKTRIDAGLRSVLSAVIATPPTTPSIGDSYIVPTGANGVWSSEVNNIATFTQSGWVYYTPSDQDAVIITTGINAGSIATYSDSVWSLATTTANPVVKYSYALKTTTSDIQNGTQEIIVLDQSVGNIPYNSTTGVWTLSAGITYKFSLNFIGGWSGYSEFHFYDYLTNQKLVNTHPTKSFSGTASYNLEFVYTPSANQQICIKNVTGWKQIYGTTMFAIIEQLGTTSTTAFTGSIQPTYSPLNSYDSGTLVVSGNMLYQAVQAVPVGDSYAPGNTAYWSNVLGSNSNIPNYAEWTSWTPTLKGSQGTNPTLGNGSIIRGCYKVVGKSFIYKLFIYNPPSSGSNGLGAYYISLPGYSIDTAKAPVYTTLSDNNSWDGGKCGRGDFFNGVWWSIFSVPLTSNSILFSIHGGSILGNGYGPVNTSTSDLWTLSCEGEIPIN